MRLLIRARNCRLGIAAGRIVPPEGRFDVAVDAPQADLLPGLVNAHDHLHRNHYGRLGRPPYPNACAWARDIQARDAAAIAEGRRLPRREALLRGAWKNLFAGVTTVVHHDAWEAAFETGFPLRVVRVAQADSLGMGTNLSRLDRADLFCLHLAEGVDAAAAAEVGTLERMQLLGRRLIAVHGVGMRRDGIARFRASGAALVWCPSSNLFLFGKTAPAELLAKGVDVLLGSDSLLTGAGNLLDELRRARALGLVTETRLAEAVGATAARRLALPMPSLEPGAKADLLLLSKPLLRACAENVLLVIAGGAVRVIHPDLVPAFGTALPRGRWRTLGSVTRWTSEAVEPAERATRPDFEPIPAYG